jgi:hypothetical protein
MELNPSYLKKILIGHKHKVMSKVKGYTEKIFTQDEVNDILESIEDMVGDLSWEYDRMSSSGQETYDKLDKYLQNL